MSLSSIKIACVGDTMLGDCFNFAGLGVASKIAHYGEQFVPDEITAILKDHDRAFCNIECAISDIGYHPHNLRSLHMRAPASTAMLLPQWGFDTVNLANNHILEQGPVAAIDTAKNLKNAGLNVIGAGFNSTFQGDAKPLKLTINGQSVVWLGFCQRKEKYAYDGGMNPESAIEQIKIHTRQQKTVIVSVHWGDELIDRPNLEQRKLGHDLVKAGATLVVGHHPHVVQGFEPAGDSLIAYSLGNFIFDGTSNLTRWSAILSVTLSGQKIIEWSAIPIIRNEQFRPALATGQEKKQIEDEMRRRNKLACMNIDDQQAYETEYHRELIKLEKQCRLSMWINLAKRMPRIPLRFWPQILARPIRRRLNRW